MAWLFGAVTLLSAATLATGSLTKCYAKKKWGAQEGGSCYYHGGMTPGDYVWVRMRAAQSCVPGGYTLVQIGESEKHYTSTENIFVKNEKTTMHRPHWIDHPECKKKIQLRIFESEGYVELRVVDYEPIEGREARAHFRKPEYTTEQFFIETKVQSEYHDIKIFLHHHNTFEIWHNGKNYGFRETYPTEKPMKLNLADFFRSFDTGLSNYGDGDIISLEGVNYLQPIIASLGSGGLYEGGIITIGTYRTDAMDILFVVDESNPEKWNLFVTKKKMELFNDGDYVASFERNSQYKDDDMFKIIRLRGELLIYDNINFDIKSDELDKDLVEKMTSRKSVLFNGEIKKVIVRGSSGRPLHITYFSITNDLNADYLSF